MSILRRVRTKLPTLQSTPKLRHKQGVHPARWNRPLAPGVLAAYDEGLKVIKLDSLTLKKQAEELTNAIEIAENATWKDETEIDVMRQRLSIVEVQSEINLPDVRWKCVNGMAQMSKEVDRHLVEQRWRQEGGLDLLMERIHQMNVVPDVLSSLDPTVDLRITFPTPPPRSQYLRENTKRRYINIEPGVYLLPEQTRNPPKLYANVFHADVRLYTLLMVDPDVLNEENCGFQTYLHWLKPNIPLSATLSGRILDSNSHTYYIPPHPQCGTPYHRYVLLLLPQPSENKELSFPPVIEKERLGFDVRLFMSKYGLGVNDGGGLHMWREVWNEEVSKIYSDVLKMREPRFGRPRKEDPYAEVKRVKRYV